jgi:histidinol-phosphate aminotransferase
LDTKGGAEVDLTALMRPALEDMEGYEPIEPVDQLAQRLGIPPERIVKLDGNENPYGPSPRALEAIARYPYYHIYPDPEQREARAALSRFLGIGEERILAGSGSDELMDIVLRLFLSPGEGVINCPPTFGMYPFLTKVVGGRVIDVPRREDFSLDVPAIEAAAKDAKLIFIASPNNPSGNVIAREELEALLATGLVVVLDEAYAEFAGESAVAQAPPRANLLVLRTLSKWAGLAGLRVGYGVFPPAVVKAAMKIKQPYNLNAAAQAALLASLADVELLRQRVRALVEERERLTEALAGIPFLEPLPSRANFILCRVDGVEARDLWGKLRERGIMVRYFDSPRVRDCLRISVGLPEHTTALVEALREIGGELGT